MAASWHKLLAVAVYNTTNAPSRTTNDKVGQEALANVFHPTQAVEELTGILTSLKTKTDDAINLSVQ